MKKPTKTSPMRDHIVRAKRKISRARQIYAAYNKPFSVNAHTSFYSTRQRATYLWQKCSMRMMRTRNLLEKNPIDPPVGPTMAEWRESNKAAPYVSKEIIAQAMLTMAPVRLSQIEEGVDGMAGRSAVKSVLKTGVELGLLKRVNDGYSLTEECVSEVEERIIAGMLNDDVIEFCRYVVMFDETRKQAALGEAASDYLTTHTTEKFLYTLIEAMERGDYDSEIDDLDS